MPMGKQGKHSLRLKLKGGADPNYLQKGAIYLVFMSRQWQIDGNGRQNQKSEAQKTD